jgi:hypothetical protein
MVILGYIVLGLLTIGLSATVLLIEFFILGPMAMGKSTIYTKLYLYSMVPVSGFLGALPAVLFNPGQIGRLRIFVIWSVLWTQPFALKHIETLLVPPSWTPDVRGWRRWLLIALWVTAWMLGLELLSYLFHFRLWP